MQYGILLICGTCDTKNRHDTTDFSIVRKLEPMCTADSEPILNYVGCPLLSLSSELYIISPANVLRPISVVHECDSSCIFGEEEVLQDIEHVRTTCKIRTFQHNFINKIFCFNIFCTGNR